MKASELIKELQKNIDNVDVGDREVYFWNKDISNYVEISCVYSTIGSIECIALETYED